jgi:hypothetical protein
MKGPAQGPRWWHILAYQLVADAADRLECQVAGKAATG